MSKIISIATGQPSYKYNQEELFDFADKVYSKDETDSRKLRFLYNHSGIDTRYSVIPDFNVAPEHRSFFPITPDLEPVPNIEMRMEWFNREAATLSSSVIEECITGKIEKKDITHLITVSCTGLSAPGLDLQVMQLMDLPRNIVRTSVNFMGCYAAVHALKLADAFCKSTPAANVIIVCIEYCTLHFQKDISIDNITASLLFGDGCAAVLVQADKGQKGLQIKSFYSDVAFKGKDDMAWELSSNGFLMTLTGYVPALIKEDFKQLTTSALEAAGLEIKDITKWCIHPGGRKILDAICSSLALNNDELRHSYNILQHYGNMSSATILFVLKEILDEASSANASEELIFGAAFGPGLTMETFTAKYD